jgi:hypothetical protein
MSIDKLLLYRSISCFDSSLGNTTINHVVAGGIAYNIKKMLPGDEILAVAAKMIACSSNRIKSTTEIKTKICFIIIDLKCINLGLKLAFDWCSLGKWLHNSVPRTCPEWCVVPHSLSAIITLHD